MSVLNLTIVAVAHPRLLADSTDSMDLANVVLSVHYLQVRRTALATVAKSSVRETERDRSIQHGNGYLAEGVVLTCSVHAQQPHHTCMYVLSKHSGNNML